MSKKYRLLKSKNIEKDGRTLYKIKALKSFGDVEKGDEGGYIEKEENLSQENTCWVYKDGIVLDDGIVRLKGEVWGGEVRGGEVRGGVVWGGVVWGGVFTKNNFQVQGSRHFINISRPNHILIGCHEHTFEYWKSNFRKVGKSEGYSKEEIKEYGRYIDMAIKFPNQPGEEKAKQVEKEII